MSYIKISNLSQAFPDNNLKVLDNLSFSIKKGEFVSFVGPSGCGKTTLFDIISGVISPTNGSIELDGKITANRAGKFGYMLQSPLLLPWKTVLENVKLGSDILKMPSKASESKAIQLLKQFGLSEFTNMYPGVLSKGMQQRVALMRTIQFSKKMLLLDEPFGALDSLTRLSCQLWLIDVFKKLNPTTLLITHDIREAIFLSDTIYILSPRPGKIIKKLEVDLSHPRRKEQLLSAKAIKLEKQILTILFKDKTL
jgi:ABC-type nitrate/sulfonate/bicarbonate transport system ATPase subunit